MVGIGASAGGLAAFEAFFGGLPAGAQPGVAFLLVQHLSPNHPSLLTELVARQTHLPVALAQDGAEVRCNCVYVIPPNSEIALRRGKLHVTTAPRRMNHPGAVDHLFQSLAEDQGERAICVVLSGTGSDGTRGARLVKEAGGVVLAQTPDSAEFDGMPRSVIGAGVVDYVLSPAAMAAQLTALQRTRGAELDEESELPADAASPEQLERLCALVLNRTGHDFSAYKLGTLRRRLERRMTTRQVATLPRYLQLAAHEPQELDALFQSLLIGVTHFFRDSAAFVTLQAKVVPQLLAARAPDDPIRVWVPGCSSGEEAYSIAILLQESLEAESKAHKVQVFATDLDARAIKTARAGVYPPSIVSQVSEERLARFFSLEPHGRGYRIQKRIRDLLVFSEQDVLKDPPFSRLDLLSCRNLLIYIGAEAQKRLLPIFHYALKPGGFLLLGGAETLGDSAGAFDPVDRAAKLFRRRGGADVRTAQTVGAFLRRQAHVPRMPVHQRNDDVGPIRHSLRERTEQTLLQHLTTAAVLVDEQGAVQYVHGRTGLYLEPAPGELGSSNVLAMAREGLRGPLLTALRQAAAHREIVRAPNLQVRTNGSFSAVDLTIAPAGLSDDAISLYLVLFEPSLAHASRAEAASQTDGERAATAEPEDPVQFLKAELRIKEEYLTAANNEFELANEELKASNEELQALNEELQSSNEELETSKEELQAVNEELATVNSELQSKVTDLSRANNDMNNLLAGTNIGTVFVDHQLRILRFTPAATRIINLIPNDIGRPVAHLASNLVGYDSLVADAQSVLDSLIPKEAEVRTQSQDYYSMSISPYRTLDNVIEGVVLTFVDITKTKRAQAALDESEARRRQAEQALEARGKS